MSETVEQEIAESDGRGIREVSQLAITTSKIVEDLAKYVEAELKRHDRRICEAEDAILRTLMIIDAKSDDPMTKVATNFIREDM